MKLKYHRDLLREYQVKNRNYKDYIVAKTIEAFERFEDDANDYTLGQPGQPSVAPEGVPVFDRDMMQDIELHRTKILNAPTFEAFMDLLQNIATEVGLNPAQDFDKLASVLNRYRVEEGLEPL